MYIDICLKGEWDYYAGPVAMSVRSIDCTSDGLGFGLREDTDQSPNVISGG